MTEPIELRDYFAGQALTGILASPAHAPSEGHRGGDYSLGFNIHWVELAYTYADAMLEERAKQSEKPRIGRIPSKDTP